MSDDQLTDAEPAAPLGTNTPGSAPRRTTSPILPISPRMPSAPGAQQQASTPSPTTPAQPPTSGNAMSPNGATLGAPAAATSPSPTPPTPTTPPAATSPAGGTPADGAPIGGADDGHDHGGSDDASSPADGGAPDEAAKPPMNPGEAAKLATDMAGPMLQAGLGLPTALMGLGSGLLAPFGQILNQFGQGNPAMPSSTGVPPGVLNRLDSTDASTGMTGGAADAYQSEVDGQARQAHALDNLEKKLRTALESSASNSTMGRDKIQQIISQVRSSLQAIGPIANTPMGQMGVLTTIAQGLQQAGAVLTEAVGKDSLNADSVKTMSAAYVKDLNTPSDEERQRALAGGGVDAWIVQGLAANGITDPRAVANWARGLKVMVQRESGGNPHVVNRSDSNAQKGTPSGGLMQMIQPTFESHWRPGTERNLFNPISSVAAAVHYVMTRYHVGADGANLMSNVQQANPYAAPKGY